MKKTFASFRGHTLYTPPLAFGPVVLDLGANRGVFSRDLHARYGGEYYLVEANPELAAALIAESRFPVFHCAVTDEDASMVFHIARNDEGSSLLTLPETSAFNCTLDRTVEVQGRRLDGLIAELGLDRIDLVKLDVEGAEGGVIASLSDETLKSIGQMAVEFHCKPVFGFDVAEEVRRTIARMRSLGFLVLDFSNGPLTDVLLINREYCGVGVLRAALLQSMYLRQRWTKAARASIPGPKRVARGIWTRLPEPVRAPIRRVLKRGKPSGR